MSRISRIKAGGWAAIIGGLCWFVKGGSILLTGNQPLVLFEIAPAFLAVAVIGLAGLLNGRSRLAQIGMIAAAAGGAAALINSLREVWIIITGNPFAEIELFSALAGFGWLLGLLLVGIPICKRRALPGSWRFLPLAMGIAIFPLLLLFAIVGEAIIKDADLAERAIEIPLMLIGLAWIALGWQMLMVQSTVSVQKG